MTIKKLYWASWERVMLISCISWLAMMFGFWVDGIENAERFALALLLSIAIAAFVFTAMGTTFFKISNNKLVYVNSLISYKSLSVDSITEIKQIPRVAFTTRVTSILIESKTIKLQKGVLISRDLFPDPTIAALVSHLKEINPDIKLDEDVQKIVDEHSPHTM